jgi:hypothetical protein
MARDDMAREDMAGDSGTLLLGFTTLPALLMLASPPVLRAFSRPRPLMEEENHAA